MGRHSTATKPRRPRERGKGRLYTLTRRIWQLLPEDWRGRVWEWRKARRARSDRRHRPRGDWDAELPTDPVAWTDSFIWGSDMVAARLRKHRRRISVMSESATDPALRVPLIDLLHSYDQET